MRPFCIEVAPALEAGGERVRWPPTRVRPGPVSQPASPLCLPQGSIEASSLMTSRRRPSGGKGTRGPRPRLFRKGSCQADGCNVDLLTLPFYYQRNHICLEHNKCPMFTRQVRRNASTGRQRRSRRPSGRPVCWTDVHPAAGRVTTATGGGHIGALRPRGGWGARMYSAPRGQ